MRTPRRHVLKDGTAVWRVRYKRAGGEHCLTLKGPDAEAQAHEFARLVDVLGAQRAVDWWNAQAARDDGPTLDEWAERHISSLTGVTDGTRITYRRMYDRAWKPALGHMPIAAIAREDVARQVNELSRLHADKTVRNQHGLLAGIMQTAVLAGAIPVSPCKGIRLPRRTEHERVEMRFLDHAEYARLEEAVPAHYRPLVRTLVGTGMRWGEAEALTVGDVDLARQTVRIVKAAKWNASKATREIGPTKTRRSRRTVELPPEVADVLRPLCSRPKAARLFTAPKGGELRHRTFYDVWKRACEEAGLDPQPRVHDLRHTHVAWLIAAGVALPVIQARLGHESITTTVDRYGHLLPDVQRAAALAASAALKPVRAIEG